MSNILKVEDQEYLVLTSICEVKMELDFLRKSNSSKEAQLECFKRLINLYSTLNVERMIKENKDLV